VLNKHEIKYCLSIAKKLEIDPCQLLFCDKEFINYVVIKSSELSDKSNFTHIVNYLKNMNYSFEDKFVENLLCKFINENKDYTVCNYLIKTFTSQIDKSKFTFVNKEYLSKLSVESICTLLTPVTVAYVLQELLKRAQDDSLEKFTQLYNIFKKDFTSYFVKSFMSLIIQNNLQEAYELLLPWFKDNFLEVFECSSIYKYKELYLDLLKQTRNKDICAKFLYIKEIINNRVAFQNIQSLFHFLDFFEVRFIIENIDKDYFLGKIQLNAIINKEYSFLEELVQKYEVKVNREEMIYELSKSFENTKTPSIDDEVYILNVLKLTESKERESKEHVVSFSYGRDTEANLGKIISKCQMINGQCELVDYILDKLLPCVSVLWLRTDTSKDIYNKLKGMYILCSNCDLILNNESLSTLLRVGTKLINEYNFIKYIFGLTDLNDNHAVQKFINVHKKEFDKNKIIGYLSSLPFSTVQNIFKYLEIKRLEVKKLNETIVYDLLVNVFDKDFGHIDFVQHFQTQNTFERFLNLLVKNNNLDQNLQNQNYSLLVSFKGLEEFVLRAQCFDKLYFEYPETFDALREHFKNKLIESTNLNKDVNLINSTLSVLSVDSITVKCYGNLYYIKSKELFIRFRKELPWFDNMFESKKTEILKHWYVNGSDESLFAFVLEEYKINLEEVSNRIFKAKDYNSRKTSLNKILCIEEPSVEKIITTSRNIQNYLYASLQSKSDPKNLLKDLLSRTYYLSPEYMYLFYNQDMTVEEVKLKYFNTSPEMRCYFASCGL
jgi:hypothetical protein